MGRIDRARFDAARFPFETMLETRYADLDQQGHVNNAAAIVLLQEGRVRFHQHVGFAGLLEPMRMMVASLTVEYAAEMRHPEPVAMSAGVLALGRTSMTLALLGRQHGRPAIYAAAVLVVVGADGPAPLPERLRQAMERQLLA